MSSPPDFHNVEVLNEFLRSAAEAIGPTLEPGQDWAPVAFVIDEGGGLTVVGTDGWSNDEERMEYVIALAAQVVHTEAAAVGMVATIWMLSSETAGEALFDEPRPRDNPLREEALQVSSFTADEALTAVAVITRSVNDPPALGEWQIVGDGVEGVMVTLIQTALRKVRDA